MKDENGALEIGATITMSDTELAVTRNFDDVKRYLTEKIAYRLGAEITATFPPDEEKRVEIDGTLLISRMIVMTPRDYKRLCEQAWKYKELTK